MARLNKRCLLKQFAQCILVASGMLTSRADIVASGPVMKTLAAPVSYLVEENFEGTGVPSGWSEVGTVNWDYTTTILQGSQSCYLNGTSSDAWALTATAFAAQSECWFYLLFRTAALPATERQITRLRDIDGNQDLVAVGLKADGTLHVTGPGAEATTVSAASANTTYHVWVHFKTGTGANAEGSVGFSTTGTRPTSGTAYASFANGTTTLNAVRFFAQALSTTFTAIVDRVLIRSGATAIPDSP